MDYPLYLIKISWNRQKSDWGYFKKVEFPIQECKSDLREHDNVVECIEWAPDSALENVQKAAGLDSKNNSGPFLVSGSRDKLIKVIFLKVKEKLEKIFFCPQTQKNKGVLWVGPVKTVKIPSRKDICWFWLEYWLLSILNNFSKFQGEEHLLNIWRLFWNRVEKFAENPKEIFPPWNFRHWLRRKKVGFNFQARP